MNANIGHNSLTGNIRDRLSQLWGGLIGRCQQLIDTASDVPADFDDEDTARKAQDLVKLMKAAIKEADNTRKQENEPFAAAKQQVDAFFNIPKEALQGASAEVERRLTRYLQRKAQREEIERRERADAERRAAEERFNSAAEAERRAQEAQQAAAIAKAAAEAARADKTACVEGARAARMRAQTAQVEAQQAKARGDGAAYTDAMNRAEVASSEAKAFDAQADVLRKQEKEADQRRKLEEAAARDATKETKMAMGEAARAERSADKFERAAEQKQADLSRTRGDLGSVGSLRTDWVHDSFDRGIIDLEALRQHLPADAIDQAIRSFIKAGGRQLRGTSIFEQTTAVVR
jgi:hypothetical protein